MRYLPHNVWGIGDYSSRAIAERLRDEQQTMKLSNLLWNIWFETRAVFEDDKQLVLKWITTEPRNAAEFERALSYLGGDSMAPAQNLLDVVGAQRIENGLSGSELRK